MSGDPAGAIDVGKGADFGFGRSAVPRERGLGRGERGVLKGWAAPVDVAGGGLEGEDEGVEDVRALRREEGVRSAEARWRQR